LVFFIIFSPYPLLRREFSRAF
jgi:hypothetical protein